MLTMYAFQEVPPTPFENSPWSWDRTSKTASTKLQSRLTVCINCGPHSTLALNTRQHNIPDTPKVQQMKAYYSLGAGSELALGDTHEPSHLIQAKKEQILRWQADQKAHTPTFEISQPSSPQTMGPGARAFLNFAPYPPLTTTTLPSQSASFPPATSRPYASGTSSSSIPLARSAQFHTGLMLPPTTEASNKKHKCPYCAAEFTRHHNLKSHLLTHAEEKPYICSTCQSRFRRLHEFETPHQATHRRAITQLSCMWQEIRPR